MQVTVCTGLTELLSDVSILNRGEPTQKGRLSLF